LTGIAGSADPLDLTRQLEPLHPKNDTFPGEVLLELAADALDLSGASRDEPVEYEGIRERYPPRCSSVARPSTTGATTRYALWR